MIIGTAGHIDHGKTALIKALTGIDADRLAEEKRRGITIDLGYAYSETAAGTMLGFVDVPGHERFVHNMLAGATGIDHALLVVAADDGVMPQTREHLAVLQLLAVQAGTVVLTKIDRVDAARLQQVRVQLSDLLLDTFLHNAPLFPVSNLSGEGIAALRWHLEAQAGPQVTERGQVPPPQQGFRLAIDRVFSLTGVGTVVTGTVHSGKISQGEVLRLMPRGQEVRVRSLHAQNRAAESARRGERCALNLAGDGFERSWVARGAWLASPWLQRGCQRFDAQVKVLAQASQPIGSWMPAHLHLGTADVMCRLLPLSSALLPQGEQGWVQVVCDSEVHVCAGDRFVLRDQGATQTLGGGTVLDTSPPSRRRRTTGRLAQLEVLALPDIDARLTKLIEQSEGAIALDPWAAQWNVVSSSLLAVARQQSDVICKAAGGGADNWLVWAGPRWRSLQAQVLDTLGRFHLQFPDELGCERDRLRRMALPELERGSARILLQALIDEAVITQTGVWLHLAQHRVQLSPSETAFRALVLRLLAATPLEPPWVRDIAKQTGLQETLVRTYLLRLVRNGDLFQVVKDLFFTQAAIEQLRRVAQQVQTSDGHITAARFRDVSGLSRKRAIQVLEYFDRVGWARRVRDLHYLRDATLAP